MSRTTTRRLAAIAVVPLALLGAACSDAEDDAEETTTTEALAPCDEVYVAGDGEPEAVEEIEARGAPELEACEPSGELQIIDEIEGSGAEVEPGAVVTAHYAGISADTGVEFDSSWSRGEPSQFPLDGVIPGWTEGLVGMKEGGRRTLVIPAELAYADSPPPASGIAPGADLVFTIDMVATETGESAGPGTVPPTSAGG